MPRASAGETRAPAATENRTLFIDCRMGTMPRKVPASGRIYALVPQHLPQENGGGGLVEYFAQPGSEWNWKGMSEWAYRCEITNYTGSLLVDVSMDFGLEMRQPVPVPEQSNALRQGDVTLKRIWNVVIAKIDVGTSDPYVFYVHNCCQDRFVYVRAPSTAGAKIGGEEVRLEMRQSAYNLSQPLNPTSLGAKR